LGLPGREDHTSAQLSGGQAAARGHCPRAGEPAAPILATSPPARLDTRTSMEVLGLVQSLHKGGITVVMVTHEPRHPPPTPTGWWSCAMGESSRTRSKSPTMRRPISPRCRKKAA